ncbi:MAG TPA: toprim domain-containing protein [Candidatus Kapabacteria bacterium]|nr:toprim domain-containing protein [Candidatus Kapabacteria bacterium]
MRAPQFNDPLCMPGTGRNAGQLLELAEPLAGTPGAAYVERRGIPLHIAEEAGVRFASDFGGRPAVLVAMRDHRGAVALVHGRYLHTARNQNKMLTVGPGGGMVSVLEGWHAEPLIIVEGLFDALSLAACGWPCAATVGRWAPWLPAVTQGRTVWLAFDSARAADAEAERYRERLHGASLLRLRPPGRSKDWNTALVKLGIPSLARWLREALNTGNRIAT